MATQEPRMIDTLNVNEGVGGTRCDASKYEAVRHALLKAVPESDEGIHSKDLPMAVKAHLPTGEIPGGGNISWYTTVVKLDLEARGLIERIPDSKPQRVRKL